MRLLFVHDGPLKVDQYNNSYAQNMSDDVFDRYYEIADKISFITRTQLIDSNDTNFKKNDMEKLKIVSAPNISSGKGQIFLKQKARQIVEKEIAESDLIIVRLPSFLSNLTIEIAQKKNKPYLIELVADPWDSYWNHSISGKIIAPYMNYKTKTLVKKASHVLYVTNEYLQNRFPTNGNNVGVSDVVLDSTDDNILENRLSKINSMNIKDKIILGTTAAIDVKYKGQQYVIDAIGKLKKLGYTNIEYQIVGGGSSAYLEEQIEKCDVKDQVKIIGPLPHDEVFNWLDTIDLYIQPSKQEGLPRALIEAMSRSLPALGSRTGGIPELLENKYIFENKNNVQEIITLLKNITKEDLLEQAEKNYLKSKDFRRDNLNNLRKEFFENYKKSALKQRQ